jgi:hypothetical protein
MEKSLRLSRHISNQESSNWKIRDKLSEKNGPHATIYLINGDRYMGDWKDNKRHGKGTHFYSKSGNKYVGEWKNDMRHGYGTLSVPEVSVSEITETAISFFDIEKKKKPSHSEDSMKLRKIYTGSWEADVRQGHGTQFFQDGSVYEGAWVNDMRQGWGRQTYADGSVFEGEWHHEARHGQGVLLLGKRLLKLVGGDRYEGMWFNDEKEGPGKFIYLKKRQCYSGEWSRGQPRCGMITKLTSIPGYPGTLYDMPPLELEDPEEIIAVEKADIYEARAKRIVGMGI